MNNREENAAPTVQAWVKPELKKINAGSAEEDGFNSEDGGGPGSILS